ncbi:MAG: amino acid ABC transporter permease [Nocardioidaceae bacterium]
MSSTDSGALDGTSSRWERMALASARIPFRLKVAVVWICIFLVVAAFFALADFDTQFMRDEFGFIFAGLKYTLYMAVVGIVMAVVLATFGALGRLSSNPIAYGISGFYVSFFRGTPLLVQLSLIYSALPQIGNNLVSKYSSVPASTATYLTLSVTVAGMLALGLNYGAYMTEIFRAGIQSVSGGQAEAADALGMTYQQKMRKVILPQALRVIIPPTGNEFIAMMKDTALVSFLGAILTQSEIFRRASYVGTSHFKNLEALLIAAGLYWALTVIFTFFQRRLESRLARGYVRTATARVPAHHSTGIPHGQGGLSGT